jgi:DNA-binding beta-propeller fold protein YncE
MRCARENAAPAITTTGFEREREHMRRSAVLAAAAASTCLLMAPAFAAGYKFEPEGKIALPGKPGHGDIVSYDAAAHKVYVSLADDGLAVVDPKAGKVAAYVQHIPAPNGNADDAHYVYVAAGEGDGPGKTNAIVVIDKKTWKEVGRVATQGTSPDWIAVDPAAHLLYTTSDDKNWIEVYSSGAHPQFKAKWSLLPADAKAGPDVATLLPRKHEIFQSDDAYVDAVNTADGKVTSHADTGVKLTKKGGTKGSIYDARHGRLWVGTTSGGIYVLDAGTLEVVTHLPSKGGIDQVAFDPKLGLVYSFEGGAKGFDVYDANTMKPVTFVSTGVGNTHTGDVDTATHLVYAYEGDAGVLGVYKPVR